MNSPAESFQLLGTLVFVSVSAVVGVRLVRLSGRSGARPELYLGLGILGTAVFGYGFQIASVIARGDAFAPDPSRMAVALTFFGKLLHDAGVTMILAFVLVVFRPGDRRAQVAFAVLCAMLWSGMIGLGPTGGYRDLLIKNPWWWLEYAVIWTYPLWPAFESFRYWGMMRRRRKLGMADPLTTNRFFLWGLASLGTFLAVAVTSFPMLLEREAMLALETASRVTTAAIGLCTVAIYALAFFPPAPYRRFLARADAPPAGEAQAV
ncbi:MAG: hypothetical protein HKP30_09780 [Myxococcales bacterium]|nr:hypothetical protein [Myxococcales bacterium]